MAKAKVAEESIEVMEIRKGVVEFCILGRAPVILARMSEKAGRELLLPRGRKSAAEKASNLKHNPYDEFRSSPYTTKEGPTLLQGLSVWFKKGLAGAALDIPGSSKAQIGRLVWAIGERVPLYGIPQLHMAVTRSADMNKTPDIRTRCIVPEWATTVSFSYAVPIMKQQVIVNLLAAAGMMQGIGDWRPQKGAGSFGQYEIVSADNEDYQRIIAQGGRAAQEAAMADPIPYNDETESLLSWFDVESKRRGFEVVA
jgi:hypothetical protein